jgi:hypothetical protein
MSEENTNATLLDGGDAVDLQVADDPEESRVIVTGMTVSASEKTSTGDYENYEPFQSLNLAFSPAIDVSKSGGRRVVRRAAAQAHHDVQQNIEQAIDNRLAAAGHDDWPDGVADAETARGGD